MTIGEAASRASTRASTIRYSESVGVLLEPERESGQRRYGVDVLRRLAIVDIAPRAGFSLDEIRELLASVVNGAGESLLGLAERKLPASSG